MLITCSGCGKAIKTPASAAGKRVKCPGCGTVLRVPESEPDATAVAPTPMPLPIEVEPVPEDDGVTGTNVTASKPPSSGAKPPTIKVARASRFDDDGGDDDLPPIRRRDADDDDFDPRRRDGTPVNSMAMTSMIMGISGVVSLFGSCCCGLFGIIALICAIMAICFGIMGKTPGSEGYAWTGIICGAITLVIIAVGIVIAVVFIGFDVAMQNMNQPRQFN